MVFLQVLSDQGQRQQYDAYGMTGQGMGGPQPGQGAGGFQGNNDCKVSNESSVSTQISCNLARDLQKRSW